MRLKTNLILISRLKCLSGSKSVPYSFFFCRKYDGREQKIKHTISIRSLPVAMMSNLHAAYLHISLIHLQIRCKRPR